MSMLNMALLAQVLAVDQVAPSALKETSFMVRSS